MASPEIEAESARLTALLQADPILGPLLAQQAAGKPFDAEAANARIQQLGIQLPPGTWISGGKVQHESKKVDNFGKAMLLGSAAAVGGYGLGAALGAGAAPAEVAMSGAPMSEVAAPGVVGALNSSWAAPAAGAAAGGGAAASAISPWLRYGLPAAASGIDAALTNRQQNQNREQSQMQDDRRVALAESQLDPFRGMMAQTNDVATLERRAAGPRSYRPAIGSGYAGSYNPANAAPPPSDTYRSTMVNARDAIARGDGSIGSMLDQENWGDTGTYDLTQPGGVSPARMIARRRPPLPPRRA